MKELLTFRLNLYRLREEREIKPETFSALLSHILYQKRCERVVVFLLANAYPAVLHPWYLLYG